MLSRYLNFIFNALSAINSMRNAKIQCIKFGIFNRKYIIFAPLIKQAYNES